jgi:S1-C subfamily serine protease
MKPEEKQGTAGAAPAPPTLGISEYTVTPAGTLLVQKLERFGACAKAGMVVGDEILGLDGQAVPREGVEDFIRGLCARIGTGGTVPLRLRRAGAELELAVKLVAKKSLSLNIEEISEVLERKIAP